MSSIRKQVVTYNACMELILFVGLQAAGKSTFYRAYFEPPGEYAYVSKDRLRNNPRPERRQQALLIEALAAGRSVVVRNPSLTPSRSSGTSAPLDSVFPA